METHIEQRLQDIDTQIKELHTKMDVILSLLKSDVSPNCNKMGNHIDFVEKVYENVKHPLNTVCNLFTSKKPSLTQTDFQIEYLE
tara:strand:- start:1005 stop:1259 length:255 start_codon:yes stop_codon:yes gene_type:complete